MAALNNDQMINFEALWKVSASKIREIHEKALLSESFKFSCIPFVGYRMRLVKESVDNGRVKLLFDVLFNGYKMFAYCYLKVSIIKDLVISNADLEIHFEYSALETTEIGTDVFPHLSTFADRSDYVNIKISGFFRIVEFFMPINNLNLEDHLWERNDKDITFDVNGEKILTHGFILSKHSAPLNSMFTNHGYKETLGKIVQINNYDFQTISSVIKLCYGQKCLEEHEDDCKTAIQVFRFADQYLIGWMKDLTENYCIQRITKTNVCDLLKIAYTCSARFTEFCMAFIAANADEHDFPEIKNLDYEIRNLIRLRLLPDREETDECYF